MTSVTDYLESIKKSIEQIAKHEARCDLEPSIEHRRELELIDHKLYTLADHCVNGEGLIPSSVTFYRPNRPTCEKVYTMNDCVICGSMIHECAIEYGAGLAHPKCVNTLHEELDEEYVRSCVRQYGYKRVIGWIEQQLEETKARLQ